MPKITLIKRTLKAWQIRAQLNLAISELTALRSLYSVFGLRILSR